MRKFAFFSVIACIALLTACKGPGITAPQRTPLGGVWQSAANGSELTIYSNGVFTIRTVPTAEAEQGRLLRGVMERGGDQLRVTFSNADLCEGTAGLYQFERDGLNLNLVRVQDQCHDRIEQLDQPWVLVRRLPAATIPVR